MTPQAVTPQAPAADDEAKHWAESKPAARAPSGEEAAANVLSEMLRAGATGNEIRAAGRQFGFDVEPVIEGAVADQLQNAVQRGAADRYLRTIARHYGYDSEELMAGLREQRSTGRNVMDTVAEAAGGIVGTAGNIVGTAGIVADYAGASEDNPAAKLSRYFHGLVPETAMADTTTGQVAQGLGSAAMFAAAGGAGRAAGMSTTAAVGTAGSVASFSPGYWDAKQHGASDVTALASGLLNAGVGYSEAFPLAKILDRATAGSGGAALRYMLSEGAEEMLQSSGQQLAGNLIAKALYDEDRAVLEGVITSGKAGFLTGAIASALGTGAARLAGPQDAGRGVPAGEARRPEDAAPTPAGTALAVPEQSETGLSDPNAPKQVLRRPNAGTLGGSAQIEGRPPQIEAGVQPPAETEAKPLDPAREAQDTAQRETFAKAQDRIEAVAYDPEPLADAVGADPDRVKKLAERMRAMGPKASVERMREIYDPASADAPLVNALHELMTGASIDEYRASEADRTAFDAKQAEIGARPQYDGPAPIVGDAEPELGVPRGTEPQIDEEGTRTNFRRGMMLLRGMRSDGRITEAQFDAGVQRLFGVTPDLGADAGTERATQAVGPALKLPKRPKPGPKSGATINPVAAVVGAIQGPQSMADEESRIEAARRMVQDRFVTLRRRERVARNKGSDLSGAETRMHGRATAKQGGLGREQDAVVKILRDSGETIEAAGDYLKARHAGPRDALIVERRAREIFEARAESIKRQVEELNRAAGMGAKVQGKLNTLSKRLTTLMADARTRAQATIPNGSGMDPARAQQILSAVTPAQKQVAAAVDRVRDTAREFMVESGLVSRETMDGWIAEFGPTYVPLKTLVEEDGAFAPGSGRSLNVRGPEADRAAGRGSEADNPLVRTFQDAQEAILRGEKNIVGQEFGKLAAQNSNPALWDAPVAGTASGEDVFAYKVAGEPHYVRVHDEQTLRTLKNLDPIQTNKLLRMAATAARKMSGLHTSRNPEFVLPNLVRDLESAGLNVSAEASVGLAARVVKNAIPNYRDAFRAIRDPQNGGTAQAREFIAEGGMTDWIEPESITKRLANMEKRLAEIPLRTKLRAIGQAWDDVSGAVENGVRLSYYKELRKLGVPAPKAIVAAKELTVNWSKKGEWGPFANTLFLFASASVNGTVRLGQVAAKNPKRAAAVAGSLMAAGYLAAMLSEAFAGEDDLDGEKWIDKRGEHDWRKYAMLLRPDGEATKLPLAPGWGYFYYLGGLAYRKQGSALAGDAFVGAVESFSPINGGSPGQLVSPWFTDPIVSVSENEDFASRTIYPEAFPGETKPEYQRTRRGTAASIALSKFASEMMGGTPARRGSIEIPPEAIDYLAAESVGGVGRFVQRAAITAEKIINGETPMWRDVPIVNRFKGDAPNTYVRQFRRDLQLMEAEAAAERAGEKFDGAVLDFLTEARAVDRIARILAKDGDQAGAEREYAEFHKRFKHATSPTK